MVIRCEWQTVLNRDYNSFLLLLNILFSAKSQLVFFFFPRPLFMCGSPELLMSVDGAPVTMFLVSKNGGFFVPVFLSVAIIKYPDRKPHRGESHFSSQFHSFREIKAAGT